MGNYYSTHSISLSKDNGGLSGNIQVTNDYEQQLFNINDRLYNLERILLAVGKHFGYELIEDSETMELEFKPTKPINYMKAKKELNE